MRKMAETSFELPPEIAAIMHWFAGQDLADTLSELGVPKDVYESEYIDIRITAFYREIWRGGFLVSARRDCLLGSAFIHLAVVEHGSTGEPVVLEWTADWNRTPPTTECPDSAACKDHFNSTDVGAVVKYLNRRVAAHLVRTPTKGAK